jgi:hypothetical protein
MNRAESFSVVIANAIFFVTGAFSAFRDDSGQKGGLGTARLIGNLFDYTAI